MSWRVIRSGGLALAVASVTIKTAPTSGADAAVGALSLDKGCHGDPGGSSIGQMLAVRRR